MIEQGFGDIIGELNSIESMALLQDQSNLYNAIIAIKPYLANAHTAAQAALRNAGFADPTPLSDAEQQAGITAEESPAQSMFLGVLRKVHGKFFGANAVLAARADFAAKTGNAEGIAANVAQMRVIGDAWTSVEKIFDNPQILHQLSIIDPKIPDTQSTRRDTRNANDWSMIGASFLQQAQDTARDEILSFQSRLLLLPEDIQMQAVMTIYNTYGTLGSMLRALRIGKNLNQPELAKLVDCSVGAISNYEVAKQFPSPGKLHAILNALQIQKGSPEGFAVTLKYVFTAPFDKE